MTLKAACRANKFRASSDVMTTGCLTHFAVRVFAKAHMLKVIIFATRIAPKNSVASRIIGASFLSPPVVTARKKMLSPTTHCDSFASNIHNKRLSAERTPISRLWDLSRRMGGRWNGAYHRTNVQILLESVGQILAGANHMDNGPRGESSNQRHRHLPAGVEGKDEVQQVLYVLRPDGILLNASDEFRHNAAVKGIKGDESRSRNTSNSVVCCDIATKRSTQLMQIIARWRLKKRYVDAGLDVIAIWGFWALRRERHVQETQLTIAVNTLDDVTIVLRVVDWTEPLERHHTCRVSRAESPAALKLQTIKPMIWETRKQNLVEASVLVFSFFVSYDEISRKLRRGVEARRGIESGSLRLSRASRQRGM
jgi:hypothetical protein